MGAVKDRLKVLLRAVGLYESARKLWARRSDWRTACRNAGYRLAGSPDKLPIPPTRLMYLAILSKEVSWFLQSSRIGERSIVNALQRNGLRMEDFDAILDFGCGCGRIMRRWKLLKGPRLYGVDSCPDAIDWCQKEHGALAEFQTNQLTPPLDREDEVFDFIYAISVFTHLTEDLQESWMKELARVLRPAGFLLFTVHGESRLHQLEPQERERFLSGQLIVKQGEAAGSNLCGAYHPERYVRRNLARGFEVVDFVPSGSRDTDQDFFLLRKPAEPGRPRMMGRAPGGVSPAFFGQGLAWGGAGNPGAARGARRVFSERRVA